MGKMQRKMHRKVTRVDNGAGGGGGEEEAERQAAGLIQLLERQSMAVQLRATQSAFDLMIRQQHQLMHLLQQKWPPLMASLRAEFDACTCMALDRFAQALGAIHECNYYAVAILHDDAHVWCDRAKTAIDSANKMHEMEAGPLIDVTGEMPKMGLRNPGLRRV